MKDLRSLLQTFFRFNYGSRSASLKLIASEGKDASIRSVERGTKRSQIVTALVSLLLVVAVAVGNTSPTRADDVPVIHVGGTLTENVTWTSDNIYVVDSQLTIPDGLTLNIGPGTIVKYNIGWGYNAISVNSGGTLNAPGTTSSPVVFTSYKDDTVGGDTNGDGSSSGAFGDYTRAIDSQNAGTVNLSHVRIGYASTGLQQYCATGASTTITDSEIGSPLLISSCHTPSQVVLQRNNFAVTNAVPLQIDHSDAGIATVAGANKNTFTGVGKEVEVELTAASVASGTTWTADNTSGAVFVIDYNPLDISGTAVFGAGTTIKTGSSAAIATHVNSGGTLNGLGTTSSPVIFTSYKDDTAGGDTNGDGSSSGGANDYARAIDSQEGGTVSMSHAQIEYATTSLEQYCATGASTTILDSDIGSPMHINSCHTPSQVVLQRNNFAVSNVIPLQLDHSDASIATVSGSNKNTFTGTAKETEVELTGAAIADGAAWTVGNASGANFVIDYNPIAIDGTLNLDAGAALKTDSGISAVNIGSTGTLNATGTSTDPVIFTSYKDDSVGGDSNGDGNSSGAAGDYMRAIDSQNGGTVNLSHVRISYASTGLQQSSSSKFFADNTTFEYGTEAAYVGSGEANFDSTIVSHENLGLEVDGSGKVSFRGEFNNIVGKRILACNWSDSSTRCRVDAAYTEWGSADGPFAINPSNNMVCGAITVSPWNHGSNTYSGDSIFGVKNCDGSSTPEDELSVAVTAYQTRINSEQIDCSNGFQDACDQIERTFSCVDAAVGLALYNSPFPAPSSSPTDAAATFSGDVVSGSTTYVQGVETSSTASKAAVMSAVGEILGIFGALTNAYNTCN